MSVCAARFHACERVIVFVCVCSWAMEGHMNRITGLSVAPNGQAIASAGWDGLTKIWC